MQFYCTYCNNAWCQISRKSVSNISRAYNIEAVTADYWHVVAQKRALSADERAKLAKLLEEVPVGVV